MKRERPVRGESGLVAVATREAVFGELFAFDLERGDLTHVAGKATADARGTRSAAIGDAGRAFAAPRNAAGNGAIVFGRLREGRGVIRAGGALRGQRCRAGRDAEGQAGIGQSECEHGETAGAGKREGHLHIPFVREWGL